MVMILREDRAKYIDKYDAEQNKPANDLMGDEFIDQNWMKAIGGASNNNAWNI